MAQAVTGRISGHSPWLAGVTGLALVAALSACAGGSAQSSAAPSASLVVASAPATTAPTSPSDVTAQTNCRDFEIAYSPVLLAVRNGVEDRAVAGLVPVTQPTAAQAASVPGAEAGVALAKMAFEAQLMRYDYSLSKPLDRASFLGSWEAARSACLDAGYHFTN